MSSEPAILDDEMGEWAAKVAGYYPTGSRGGLEFRFTRRLILAARWWTTFIEERVRSATGHTRARWQTLFALAFSERPPTILALSERVGSQWPTLVRTLNALEEEKLIERLPNPDDGRSRLISITPAGLAVVLNVQEVLDPNRHDVLQGFTDQELETATRVLAALMDRIRTL